MLAASSVRMKPYTIHGWRPTSVTIHPNHRARTAPGPAATAAR